MSNHPGLSSARILWVSLPWIPITRDSSPHPAIYLVINLYSSLAHTVPRTESSSILRIFFPLLQVSWLIKICFYHFNYCPTLVFLWHATLPSTKLLLTLAGENELHLLWILISYTHDLFIWHFCQKQSCSIVISQGPDTLQWDHKPTGHHSYVLHPPQSQAES